VVPDPDTFRIALVGSSHDMGMGVEDDQTYENLAEDRLNAELGPRTGFKYELLNNSYTAYTPTQKLAVLKERTLDFGPDLVLYAASSRELTWMFMFVQLQHLARQGLLDQFPYVTDAMTRAGVGTGIEKLMAETEIDAKLKPYAEETLQKLLVAFRDAATSGGAQTAMLIVELPTDTPERLEVLSEVKAAAEAAGMPVLDVQGVYDVVPDRRTLWIAPWDDHTNAAGHQLLADRLYGLLVEQGLVPTEAPSD
jgi:hypothetical protein